MADNDGNDPEPEGGEGDEPTPKQTAGKVMRQKLEDTLAENQTLKGQLAVHEAGLGHLTEKQRNAAIRDATEGGAELTAESLKKSAKELGFPEKAQAPSNGSEGGGSEGGDDGGAGGEGNEPDPANSMEAIEQAQRKVVTVPADGSFEHKLKNAKSAAEVEALIRTEGHKVGIVHEWDVE